MLFVLKDTFLKKSQSVANEPSGHTKLFLDMNPQSGTEKLLKNLECKCSLIQSKPKIRLQMQKGERDRQAPLLTSLVILQYTK